MLSVRVVRLSSSSLEGEYEALAAEPDVELEHADEAAELGAPDLVLLPGSEATVADLGELRGKGLDAAIARSLEQGSMLLGICGGFQMMGMRLHDPALSQGTVAEASGLGYFDLTTTFAPPTLEGKVTATCRDAAFLAAGERVAGWEDHSGRSTMGAGTHAIPARVALALFMETALDGVCPLGLVWPGGEVVGTYLHGVLEDATFRRRLLEHLRARRAARDRRAPAAAGTCAIRAVRAGDARHLAELSGELGYPASADEMARRLAALAADPAHAVLVAEGAGGAVAGFAHACVHRGIVDVPRVELEALVVAADQRSRGVGQALVAAVEAWARARGLGEIGVRSNVIRERAHRFYRGLGYELVKTQGAFRKKL